MFQNPHNPYPAMKNLLLLLLPLMMLSCCEDDDAVPQPAIPPPCVEVACETEDEFFGKAIRNGECWKADTAFFFKSSTKTSIYLDDVPINGIEEGLIVSFFHNANLEDTLWFDINDFRDPAPHIASARYSYREFHGVAGSFSFLFGHELTYEDYLLIDYFNADTSIIEGHFQVYFPDGSVNSYINAPDSMRFGCGSFRARAL
jgi:hypothetical protein